MFDFYWIADETETPEDDSPIPDNRIDGFELFEEWKPLWDVFPQLQMVNERFGPRSIFEDTRFTTSEVESLAAKIEEIISGIETGDPRHVSAGMEPLLKLRRIIHEATQSGAGIMTFCD